MLSPFNLISSRSIVIGEAYTFDAAYFESDGVTPIDYRLVSHYEVRFALYNIESGVLVAEANSVSGEITHTGPGTFTVTLDTAFTGALALGTYRVRLELYLVDFPTIGLSNGTVECVVGGGSSGTVVNTGTATIDFGAFPGSNEASVVVSGLTGIVPSSVIEVWVKASSTADHSLSDHTYAALLLGISAGNISSGVGFTIYARCLDKMQGTFALNYTWI